MNKTFSLGLILIIAASYAIMAVVTIPANSVALVQSPVADSNADMVYASVSLSSSNNSAAMVHSDIDVTPIAAVITITKGPQGNTIFNPQTTTIKTGEEVLVLNNDTTTHTVTNGMSPNDPLSGKLFNTGNIEPRGFIEYVASNLQPGTYPFYSASDPSVKGELVVTGQ
jgi:plastocyanin